MEWSALQAWASINNNINKNEIHLGTFMFYESSHFQIGEPWGTTIRGALWLFFFSYR